MRAFFIVLVLSTAYAAVERFMPAGATNVALNAPSRAAAETQTAFKVIAPVEEMRTDRQPADFSPAPAQKAPFQSMLDHLHATVSALEQIPAYTATLEQQVVVGGALRDPETIELKLRRSPFSVYMRWREDGQEVLYVDGQNDGKLLARPTRGLASLRGMWKLPPESAQAMKQSRYPVTKMGIENLAQLAIDFHKTRNFSADGIDCTSKQTLADGKQATVYTLVFASEQASPDYSRSVLTFDKDSGLLVAVENNRWESDGKAGGLLEKYVYHDFNPSPELGDKDFSPSNPEYAFKK